MYLPTIFDIGRLFTGCDLAGFRHGSTILIAGPPGAGKTVFSLAIVRMLMKEHTDHKLYFISTEQTRESLQQKFGQFGWFLRKQSHGAGEDDQIFSDERVRIPIIPEIKLDRPLRGAEDLVNLVFSKIKADSISSPDEPVFVVVDSLTAILKDSPDAGERRRQAYEFITHLKGSFSAKRLALTFLLSEQALVAVESIPAEDFVSDFIFRLRLKDTGAGQRLRIMDITKSHGVRLSLGEHSWAILGSNGIDDVIAQKDLKEHIREITVGGCVGSSRWGTIAVFPRPQLPAIGAQNQIPQNVDPSSQPPEYPPIWSGTPGLDEMLLGNAEYWTRSETEIPADGPRSKALIPGNTTLLLGASGTGKTILCVQFLLADDPSQSLYVNFEDYPSRVARSVPSARANFEKCHMLYRRRANLDFNILIAELRHVVSKNRITRVAIDGLSELLSTTEPGDYSRILEVLLKTIWHAKPPAMQPATIFMTLEMEPSTDMLPITKGLSSIADNVVVLRQLSINDELRKTAHLLKARGLNHDRQVRELRISQTQLDTLPLTIHAGLESFTNLLMGPPKPVRVVLQLFAENAAERRFNQLLVSRLRNLFDFKVRTFGFSRSEITRTLEDVVSPSSRVPPWDVKVLTLDEWWIREHGIEARVRSGEPPVVQRQHPLMKLDHFYCPAEKSRTVGLRESPHVRPFIDRPYYASQSEFWVFEVEKASIIRPASNEEKSEIISVMKAAEGINGGAGQGELLEADLLAIPNYTDFGMFCVNEVVASFCHVLPEAMQASSNLSPRERWIEWLSWLPRAWVKGQNTADWFAQVRAAADPRTAEPEGKPSGRRFRSLVELLAFAKQAFESKQSKCQQARTPGTGAHKKFVGFSFDMETIETAVCVLLEFAWSFGAAEDFLIADAIGYRDLLQKQQNVDDYIDRLPSTSAMRFLEFLVVEGFMAAHPTLESTSEALFSRHWYSTMLEGKDQKGDQGSHVDPFPLPFFPVGIEADAEQYSSLVCQAFHDCCIRFERLLNRSLAAAAYRGAEQAADQTRELLRRLDPILGEARKWLCESPNVNALSTSLPAHCKALLEFGQQLQRLVLDSGSFIPGKTIGRVGDPAFYSSTEQYDVRRFLPAARSMDSTDVQEILGWHDFRLKLLTLELEHKSLADAFSEFCGHAGSETHSRESSTNITAITGYGCSGSWMVGVQRPAHSPTLSWKFIEEMTSLRSACDRQQTGAGIPSRKDFFSFHGDAVVKNIPHLTWHELLKFGASRGRRRDRTICPGIRVLPVFELIYRRMRHCMANAQFLREQRDATSEALASSARAAIKSILDYVVDSMDNAGTTRNPCSSCPNPGKCGINGQANHDPTVNGGGLDADRHQ